MGTTSGIASSKVTAGDRASRWYDFYAMFSVVFAESVFDNLALPAGAVCFDPWLGSGTSAAVAAARGCRALGFDVNPVMVEVSRGRVCGAEQAARAREVLLAVADSPTQEVERTDPLLEWLMPKAAARIRHWEFCTRRRAAALDPAARGYLLTSVFGVMKRLCKQHRSKNPTWYKVPAPSHRTRVADGQLSRLLRAELERRLELVPRSHSRYVPRIQVGDATSTLAKPGSVDLVLTSPPYCTRIDYAVSTKPELAVLGLSGADVSILRNRSMGTSTVRPAAPTDWSEWGDTCQRLLHTVTSHPSKASEGYYLKTLVQYFSDLWNSLQRMGQILKPGGTAILVVQDSYYKSTHIDLARITEEMAHAVGWSVARRDQFPVAASMRRVNTRSRRYLDRGECVETALWFRPFV